MSAVVVDPDGEASTSVEKEAASFKYRWPSVVLIVSRAQWEIGRTKFLISSAVVTIGVKTRGVLSGIRAAKK